MADAESQPNGHGAAMRPHARPIAGVPQGAPVASVEAPQGEG